MKGRARSRPDSRAQLTSALDKLLTVSSTVPVMGVAPPKPGDAYQVRRRALSTPRPSARPPPASAGRRRVRAARDRPPPRDRRQDAQENELSRLVAGDGNAEGTGSAPMEVEYS